MELVAAWSPPRFAFGKLYAGLGVKYLRSKLMEEISGSAYGADVGLLWEHRSNWRLGFSCLNLGPGMVYAGGLSSGQKDNLPRTLRAGLSRDYRWVKQRLTAAVEASKTLNNPLSFSYGSEYTYRELVSLRWGYLSYYQDKNYSEAARLLEDALRLDPMNEESPEPGPSRSTSGATSRPAGNSCGSRSRSTPGTSGL
ncbi:MAG: hypothetical protein HY748_13915 [Elusimicrobia bacterium]|nr:hypothetical protein [Elusimicrobiota bacterium]